MIRYRLNMRFCWLLLMALSLGGCLGRSAPEVTFFSLLSMEQMGDAQTLGSLPGASLGIGPVTIPDSLKRSQVVTRSQGNQYAFDEFHRWAGLLEKDVAVVLGDNLGQLLDIDMVGHFPWQNYFHPTYRVIVDVQQLDGALGGEAVLVARWAVADTEGKELIAARKSVYRQASEDAGYAGLVRAESQLVAALSREIGEVLLSVSTQK